MSDSARPLLILGTGNFAAEVADLVSDIGGWTVTGFVESLDRERSQARLEDLPIFWVDDIARWHDTHWAMAALGTTRRDQFIRQVDSLGFRFATLVHPTARVSKKSTLGAGSLVSAAAVIAAHASLAQHVLVNRGVLIGHHTRIDEYVTVGPGANVAGACHIAEGAYIGMGALVLDHVRIGVHAVVAAGAVVTKEVPEHVMVAGVPAKVVKENIGGL